MKIYTKTGDSGMTGLFGGPRVSKADPRIAAYGTIDELNAVLGIVRSLPLDAALDPLLADVQAWLFSIGAELATPEPEKQGLKWSGREAVQKLEDAIDRMEGALVPLKNFILPGGGQVASHLHLARTVCRRAEREIVALMESTEVSDPVEIIVFLNRLSDLLFVMARYANHLIQIEDIPWVRPT